MNVKKWPGTKCRRKIAENYNRLSMVHERYRQTDRQTTDRYTTGGRATRSLKMGRKLLGGSAPFLGRRAGSPSTQCGQDQNHLRAKCLHLDPSSRLAIIDIGRKLGRGSVPLFGRGAGSSSNTMLSGPRPTSVPSGILIHAAVWPP